jgi:hypothetical protein
MKQPNQSIRNNKPWNGTDTDQSRQNRFETSQKAVYADMSTSESTPNTHYGDEFDSSEEFDTILFHNINGMKDTTNWYQILLTMKELNVDIFGFAEIN